MIIIGDTQIPYGAFLPINSAKEISNTPPNSTVIFSYDIELLNYTFDHNIASGVIVSQVLEALYAHNLGAKYIIASKELAMKIQDLADHYLFDSKILAIIEDQNEIEPLAFAHVDGAIYKDILG